jgi:hypothetical protein
MDDVFARQRVGFSAHRLTHLDFSQLRTIRHEPLSTCLAEHRYRDSRTLGEVRIGWKNYGIHSHIGNVVPLDLEFHGFLLKIMEVRLVLPLHHLVALLKVSC